MEYIRSFIAIEIDEKTRKTLSTIQNELKKINADLKLVQPLNIHLTLQFLGNIRIEMIEALKKSLSLVIANFTELKIKPQGLGGFPNIKNPRVIWVGIEKGKDELAAIYEKINTELEKLNIQTEDRKFHPHLTLARIRSGKNKHLLTKILKEYTPPLFEEIPVQEITFFKSTLTPEGPCYEILTKWKLKKK